MSAFLTPPETTTKGSLAIISLGREHIPAVLGTFSQRKEGKPKEERDPVTHTRFGSYPHSTILNLPWGSQVLASNIGAHERHKGKKRKRAEVAENGVEEKDYDAPVSFEAAASGFAHIIPPTPEVWTSSLPHRTQVVYTPDYSFVLQKLCARPGTRIIEAGAGSGSFTHATARAVFNGYPSSENSGEFGKVFSYEYHEPRYHALREEIQSHGLKDIVKVTHRDVYEAGFCMPVGEEGPNATAVFIDLPSPWLALPHLTRSTSPSPLNQTAPIHICCFSPCVEQASRTANTLRSLGYVSIEMFTIQHRQHLVRRERISLLEEGSRTGIAAPANVGEAIDRLRELNKKQIAFLQRRKDQISQIKAKKAEGQLDDEAPEFPSDDEPGIKGGPDSKTERMQRALKERQSKQMYKEGRLAQKTEPELKTHTSFLLFAVLPREWTEEDEERCERELEAGKK